MRTPKYISPSSLAKWEESRETFYMFYLCDYRTPRPPQKDYMAMGSALDAFVKSEIHRAIHGEAANKGTPYEFQTLFEAQVEPHIRDTVLERSQDLFTQYVECGAFASLLADVQASPFAPQMEFEVQGVVGDVPLLGKPDLRYVTKEGVHVIADWKVNGSMSSTGASPQQGYKVCRDYGSNTNGKPFRARRLKTDPDDKVYKDYKPMKIGDTEINEFYMEDYVPYWADQLAIYSWLLSEPVGSEDYIVRIEQVACRPVKTRELPRAKFACHMSRISSAHQEKLLSRIRDCWSKIQSGHIFDDVSREESDAMCEVLDMQAQTPKDLQPALGASDEFVRFKPRKT